MLATKKIKWLGTLTLAGILLLLALIGGNWGTTYAAVATVNIAPHIDSIDPFMVDVGSDWITMLIYGSNFGTDKNAIGIRIKGPGVDLVQGPLAVVPTVIIVAMDASLLDVPVEYKISVIRSNPHTVPTIPITPYDETSNEVPFYVLELMDLFLPVITK